MNLRLLTLSGGIFFSSFLFSQQNADVFNSLCRPAFSNIDLDINNIRAQILVAGDMWWDLSQAGYEIPKDSQKNSIFSGGLWFGTLDDQGQLLCASMTYRQTGNDFWAGPIDTANATTNDSTCWKYDRFWKLNRADVEAFTHHYNDPSYQIPEAILTWPGNGNVAHGEAHYLAPFKDVDGDGIYNPLNGDYPAFSFNGMPDCNTNLLGDQATWWIFNDAANVHSETAGNAFGMEVHAMAYAFHTNDYLNNATLYRYQIINRSTTGWHQMYMTQFCDVDLGYYGDDYVGCDVTRGMGYGFNGDADDGSSPIASLGTYGDHPPAVGIDFVQGPLADANDFIDNDRDGVIDENGERIAMSNFIYYNNDFSAIGNPENAQEYYYYMQSKWKDGSPQTYGGNAYGGSVLSKFMFPGNSDPTGWGTNGNIQPPWSEATAGDTPGDRRFLTGVGPFTMLPGEIQTVTIAVPWARDSAGNNFDAVTKLQVADDYVQQLFDNCFSLPCSAHAPVTFSSSVNGTNVFFTPDVADGIYSWNFGDNNSSSTKFPSHTYSSAGTYHVCLTVITACDTQTVCNDVTIEIPIDECGPPIQRLEGKGSGNQIIDITDASINEALTDTSHRTYFPWYKPLHAPVKVTYENYSSLVDGNYRIAFDSVANSAHWKMWIVGRTDTVYSDDSIGSGNKQIIPQWGLGVQVLQVPKPGFDLNPNRNGFLEATMTFSDPQKNWLTGVSDVDFPSSYNWIRSGSFRAFTNPSDPCNNAYDDRFLGSTPIDPNADYENMIGRTWAPYRLGSDNATTNNTCYTTGVVYPNAATMVQNKFENISNVDVVITSDRSKWSRCVVLETGANPSLTENGQLEYLPRLHASVDKNGLTVAQGGISDVNNPDASDFVGTNGMGWFPGYAIDIESGERLNICFGENSALAVENGRDMLWDPTEHEKTNLGEPLFGGMQYIYVFGHNGNSVYTSGALAGQLKDMPLYDDGRWMNMIFSSFVANTERTQIFQDAMWTSIPMLRSGHPLFESDVTVRLRIEKPFVKYNTSSSPINNDFPMYGFSIDKLNIDCNMYNGSVLTFPNPFSQTCTIIFDNTANDVYSLKLYDVRGRLVRLYDNITDDRVVIDGLGLDNAVYVYALQRGNEKPVTGRIIFLQNR